MKFIEIIFRSQVPTFRDSADILVLKLRCKKRSAYTESPTPPLIVEEAKFVNTYISKA
jgi:hypothetical protein